MIISRLALSQLTKHTRKLMLLHLTKMQSVYHAGNLFSVVATCFNSTTKGPALRWIHSRLVPYQLTKQGIKLHLTPMRLVYMAEDICLIWATCRYQYWSWSFSHAPNRRTDKINNNRLNNETFSDLLPVRCWPNSSHIISHQHACQNLSLIIKPIRLKIDDPQLQYRAKDLIIPAHDS